MYFNLKGFIFSIFRWHSR